ncbi:MAG TPA: hypothetical protein V6C85_03370, partial [Allocoleopsis sp.]
WRFGRNHLESLSGIETSNAISNRVTLNVAIILNPYQGLKLRMFLLYPPAICHVAIILNPYQGLKHLSQ